jgi:hypothetical protein
MQVRWGRSGEKNRKYAKKGETKLRTVLKIEKNEKFVQTAGV